VFGRLALLARPGRAMDVEIPIPARVAVLQRHVKALDSADAREWTCTDRRQPGRPSTGLAVRTLIVWMVRENPVWGSSAPHR